MNRKNTLSEIQSKMTQALVLMKKSLDMSVSLLESNQDKRVKSLWKEFLQEFFSYVRQKNKKTRYNLFTLFK